jgi:CheY-like chemotaxis protein
MERKSETTRCRVLVVEDEYFLASDLCEGLRIAGVEVIGPIGDVKSALKRVAEGGFDAAIIDMDLDGKPTYEVADQLRLNDIPFLFATGYGKPAIPARFHGVMRFEKPYQLKEVVKGAVSLCSVAVA